MHPNWSQFTKRIPIEAGIQTVYNAWTSQEELEKWFLRKAEFTRPDGSLRKRNESIEKGDEFLWIWHGYPDDVFEKKERRRISLRFQRMPWDKARTSKRNAMV